MTCKKCEGNGRYIPMPNGRTLPYNDKAREIEWVARERLWLDSQEPSLPEFVTVVCDCRTAIQ